MRRREAIRHAIADFDALHGPGAAVRDLALGLLACMALAGNVIGLAVAFGVAP